MLLPCTQVAEEKSLLKLLLVALPGHVSSFSRSLSSPWQPTAGSRLQLWHQKQGTGSVALSIIRPRENMSWNTWDLQGYCNSQWSSSYRQQNRNIPLGSCCSEATFRVTWSSCPSHTLKWYVPCLGSISSSHGRAILVMWSLPLQFWLL